MEEWKVYPEFPTYEISNKGQVKNIKRGTLLKLQKDKDGYLCANMSYQGKKYHRRVHRLVAITFIDNPENYELVDHIDRNKENNYVSNLRWTDIQGNNRNKETNASIEICDIFGNVIRTFNSIIEASEFYNISDIKLCTAAKVSEKLNGYIRYSK